MERITPQAAGLNAAQLGRIEPILQSYIDKGAINGASAMILRHGKVAYETYQGMADATVGLEMQPNIIYRIYSMTKIITAVAALKLYERGLYGIDDPIADYIPSFADTQVLIPSDSSTVLTRPAKSPITIRQLFCHTSGLSYGDTSPQLRALFDEHLKIRHGVRSDLTTMEFISTLGTFPVAFDPGTQFQYGLSIDVLGALIEAISGKRFGQFLQDEIYDPLGMNDTFFQVPESKLDRFSACDWVTESGETELVDRGAESAFAKPSSFESGGGGGLSSMEDYARFCQMLLNGGTLDGERILGPATVNWMASDHLSPELRESYHNELRTGYSFGLSVRVMLRPAIARFASGVGEYGWGGAASTWYAIDPVNDMVLVLMTQLLNNDRHPFRDRFAAAAYAALED